MLININTDKIDVRTKKEIYADYVSKRLNVNFLCRTIIEDVSQENSYVKNIDSTYSMYSYKSSTNNNRVKSKHRSKNKKGS